MCRVSVCVCVYTPTHTCTVTLYLLDFVPACLKCQWRPPCLSDASLSLPPDSILHQLFIVRFLGSMEVKETERSDVIYETMRQILAARAIHNIFRMTESHLLVTCDCLK